jgi:hypothetical protein
MQSTKKAKVRSDQDKYDDLLEAYDTDVRGLGIELEEARLQRDIALRALGSAPHSPQCASLIPMRYHPSWKCDCWKSAFDTFPFGA